MIKESNAMRELHEIRENNSRLYQTMTIDEQVKYTKDKADEMKRKIAEIRKSKDKAV